MTREEKIESIQEFINDTQREMEIAREFYSSVELTKMKLSLKEAERQLSAIDK